MKYRLLKDLVGIPAGTIFIEDKGENRWYPATETDIDLQFNSPVLFQNNPDWFAPFDGYFPGIDEHTWVLTNLKNADDEKDYEGFEIYTCSTQGCDATLTQPEKPSDETLSETPSETPAPEAPVGENQPTEEAAPQETTPQDNQPA